MPAGGVPYWVPLLVVAVGFVATLAGVFSTQRRSDKREHLQRQRQRERERENWALEDAACSYEHRLEAYVDVPTTWSRLHRAAKEMPRPPEASA